MMGRIKWWDAADKPRTNQRCAGCRHRRKFHSRKKCKFVQCDCAGFAPMLIG